MSGVTATMADAGCEEKKADLAAGRAPLPGQFARLAARIVLFLAGALVLVLAARTAPEKNGIYMDQMTFLLQTLSVAHDGDFRYTQTDRERFKKLGWGEEPLGLFLRRHGEAQYFAKPVLYALLAAPFARCSSNRGPLVLNALLWIGLVELSYRWFRRRLPPVEAALLALLCWGATAAPFYVFVIHADMLIIFLLAAALYLGLAPLADADASGGQVKISALHALLFGLVNGAMIYEKQPFALFSVSLLVLWWWRGRPASRRLHLWLAAGSCLVLTLGFSLLHYCEDGSLSPYAGDRVMVREADPFSAKAPKAASALAMRTGDFYTKKGLVSRIAPTRILQLAAYSPHFALHYLVGRRVGLFPYMTPFLLLIALAALALRQKPGRYALWVLAPAAAYVAFYFVLTPLNYHGGQTSLGNRYGLQVAPAFIFAFGWAPVSLGLVRLGLLLLGLCALYFPGRAFFAPATAVRDNHLIFQWNRFRLLPLEPELLMLGCDRDDSKFTLEDGTFVVRLSEPDPLKTHTRFWCGEGAKSRFGILRLGESGRPFEVRLSSATHRVHGYFESAGKRTEFLIEPNQSRLFRPLTEKAFCMGGMASRELFYWPLSIRVDRAEKLTSDSGLPENAALHVGLAQPLSPLYPERKADGSFEINPGDPRAGSLLLWGWWDASQGPAPERWSGETRSSALALPAHVVAAHPARLLLTGNSVALPLSASMRTLGGQPQHFVLHPAETSVSLPLEMSETSQGEALLRFEHEQLRVPAELTHNPSGDQRALAGLYRRFVLCSDAGTSTP